MVSRRVMMAAATHSHSSRLSMRRKLPWGSFDCANRGLLTVFFGGNPHGHRTESTLSHSPSRFW
jgi:hypothetical protein